LVAHDQVLAVRQAQLRSLVQGEANELVFPIDEAHPLGFRTKA
jgi:hypothetical protein